MYKRALNAFFLKVHPDFFHHNKEQQLVNESAVAQLNELLSWAKEFQKGSYRPPPAKQITFTFYRRADDGREGEEAPHRAPSSSSTSEGVHTVQSTFTLPDGFSASEANKGIAERAVNKFLRDLLRRSDCIDSVADNLSAAEDAAAARMEAKPLRRRRQRPKAGQKSAAGLGQEGEGEEGGAGVSSLLNDAVETLALRWTLTPAPTLEELIEADQILFSKSLSPLQSSAALHTLRSHLGELRYNTWEGMPLIISDRFALGEVTGSLTVPWDFTAAQFLAFLAYNEAAVHACREEAGALAGDVERLISEVSATCSLDDILISCPHREALQVLRLLHKNRDMLATRGVTELTLEIGSRYATRANGVLILDSRLQSSGELARWVERVTPKLALQKELYRVSKKMLESTLWHLREFREMVQPGGLECFQLNDCTYAQRLAWAKELYRVGAALAQWDWSEFTFLLVPTAAQLELDWAGRQMSLPYNFDGDALLRYVEEVQQGAKAAARAALLQQSATQRQETAASQEEAHAAALQQQLGEDEPTAATAPPTGEGAAQAAQQGGWEALDREAAAAREAQLRALYRTTSPHLEEYLRSAPTYQDRHAEPLKVERPLAHALTFNSDAEAAEQLKWEGFHESPYVDQVPTGDIDDLNHTFAMTNRWHREAAAKQLLEELQQTYGKKGRKFDYQKMGDVLEINNVRVQPKGFPTLTRGVRGSAAGGDK